MKINNDSVFTVLMALSIVVVGVCTMLICLISRVKRKIGGN